MDMEILNGNELLVQGGLEAGFSLYTGYPGSPLADYFNILYKRKKEFESKGIKVVIANSEANAAAMASGAKMAGQNTMVAMKSMGLHVAADPLSVGNFANPGPTWAHPLTGEECWAGVVVVVGDDPWSISTSTPADSRFLYKHLHIPFLEPSTPQELKDWVKVALDLSQRSSVYIGLLLTTSMAEGGGRVQVQPAKTFAGTAEKIILDPASFDLQKNVMVPPNSLWADRQMIEKRFPKVVKILSQLALDRTFGNLDSSVGFLSAGVVAETTKQYLEEKGLLKDFSFYKLGSSYPLVEDLLLPYLKKVKTLVIVEEKRGFLENEIVEFCQKHDLRIEIYGKNFGKESGFPAFGGISYEILLEKIPEILAKIKGESFSPVSLKGNGEKALAFPPRFPTFCPGCPHRETLSLLKEIRALLEKEKINLVSHGDVGCYSLSFLPPFKEMHDLSAMGQGGAMGAGTDIFIGNPSVVLMGDSTFYHSGISAISNSLQLGHNITYILLDNDNTAMTGHQMTPASGQNVRGEERPRQSMAALVRAMGVPDVCEVNPSDRYFYKNLLLSYIQKEGLKVVISNKECGLTFHGRERKEERKIFAQGKTIPLKTFYQVNTQACEDCRECVEMTGCPGLGQVFDGYGSKVTIDPQICVSDSYCTKIKACPSFEKVEVEDYHPTLHQGLQEIKTSEALPLPRSVVSFEDLAGGKDFRVVVTGVGGSGVTTISRVLAEAAREMGGREDLDFKFFEQKGLAQRNGSVTGFLSIFRRGKSHGTVIPLGTADLVLSTDVLEGSRSLDYLGEKGLAVLDSEYQIPLSVLLDRGEKEDPVTSEELKERVQKKLGDRSFLFPMKRLSQDTFQRPVYASTLCLGFIFQAGRLPFSLQEMETALKRAIPKDELSNNRVAFELGRKIFLGDLGEKATAGPVNSSTVSPSWEEDLLDSFLPWQNGTKLVQKAREVVSELKKNFPFLKEDHLWQYTHDLFLFDRGRGAQAFLEDAVRLKSLYKDEDDLAMGLRTLAKTYFIKDEIFVAHLLISPLKREEDRKKYGLLGKGFKVTHINRPSFDLWGKKWEFDINSRPWMLKVMRHMRFLRQVLPGWHQKEREWAGTIRHSLLQEGPSLPEGKRKIFLRKLDNIKGYREIRYAKADKAYPPQKVLP